MTEPQPNARRESALRFFGLERSIVGTLAMIILVGMGEKMAERFLPLYLVALGGGVLAVGLLNGMDNLLSALYALVGGRVSDRIGVKRSLFYFNAVAMVGFSVVIIVPRWEAVIVASALFLSWTAISMPATMSLIARVLPQRKRTMGVSVQSLVRRVPMALGPVVGGALISARGLETGIRLAFGVALAMALGAILLQRRLIQPDAAPDRASRAQNGVGSVALWRMMSPSLRRLLVSDILIRFCEQIPYAFVALWCVQTIEKPVSAFQFGILTAIEMATATLVYLPVAYFADKGEKKPFVLTTFVFFTLFPLALLFSRSFTVLVFAFILRGMKEFGEPTRKALIMNLAPDEHKAGMFGLYYLIRDLVVSVAAFGGAFLWAMNPAANLVGAFAFGLMGTLWFLWKGQDESSAVRFP